MVHFEAVGMMDLEAGKPMQRDTIFRIYSMTKPIVSMAAMMLWEENRFELDDPVSKFIPALRGLPVFAGETEAGLVLEEQEREFSVRDLLRHTSGLSAGWRPDSPIDALYRQAGLRSHEGTLQELVSKLARIPLHYQPGTRWHYGVSTDVLGYLIEQLSGQRLDALLRERIFEPLGMPDTGFYVPEARLLRAETVELMTRNHLPEAALPIDFGFAQVPAFPGTGFGLGFSVRVDLAHPEVPGSLGEYGWGGAASTRFWIAPSHELIGLVMTQFMPDFTYPIDQEVKALSYAALLD